MQKQGLRLRQINIAAFLYSSGLQLIGTSKVNGEVFFEFFPKEQAKSFVNSYFTDTATCNPRELFARLNDIRDLIFSGGHK